MKTNQEYRNLEDKVNQPEAEKAVLQEALNKLDASIPSIKAQAIRDAIEHRTEYCSDWLDYNGKIYVSVDGLKHYANQIEKVSDMERIVDTVGSLSLQIYEEGVKNQGFSSDTEKKLRDICYELSEKRKIENKNEELEAKIKQLESQVMSVEEAKEVLKKRHWCVPSISLNIDDLFGLDGYYHPDELMALATLLKAEQDNG